MSTHPELYEEAVKQEEAELASDLDAKEKQIKQASDAMLNDMFAFVSKHGMTNAEFISRAINFFLECERDPNTTIVFDGKVTRISQTIALEDNNLNQINVFSSMQLMENAPKDRNILIKLANSDEYIIAKYAEWDAPKSRYDKVWEVEPGQCFVYNSKELEGWWDLPKSAKT